MQLSVKRNGQQIQHLSLKTNIKSHKENYKLLPKYNIYIRATGSSVVHLIVCDEQQLCLMSFSQTHKPLHKANADIIIHILLHYTYLMKIDL